MKKVSKYIIITLLLLLGLCCVGVLYLFFIPNSSLFNITYISNNEKFLSTKYDAETVSRIVLNSRSYDVVIQPTDEGKIYAEVYSNSFGFVLKKNETLNISSSIKNNILTINIHEPYGFATKNTSYIKLNIPENKEFDLSLSNKSATTLIDHENIKINDLKFSTQSGNFKFYKGSISGKLDLDLNKSTFTIDEDVTTNLNAVNLKLTKGKFLAENSSLGNISVLENERGVIKIGECKNFNENINSAGGQIHIKKCANITVATSDTNIYVDTVNHGADITLTGTGEVNITTLYGVSTIITQSGNINLVNVESTLTVKTDTGDVNISSAKLSISASTNDGNMFINFSEDADTYSTTSIARVLYAEINNGSLTATGVEHIGSTDTDEGGIKISGNGRVFINMRNVYGKNDIAGKNGNVNVVVNKDSSYTLQTSSNSGNVRVNLTQISEFNGYTEITPRITNVNCSSSSNSLTISTNKGNLTVLDTNFA